MSPSEVHEYSDALLSIVLGIYSLLLLISFVSNILLANVIKRYRWVSYYVR